MKTWAAISKERVLSELCLFDIMNPTGKIKSFKDSVWKEICRSIESTQRATTRGQHYPASSSCENCISSSSLYILQDRNNVLTKYKDIKGVYGELSSTKFKVADEASAIEISDQNSLFDDNDIDHEPYDQNHEHPCYDKKINFTVTVLDEKWKNVQPIEKQDRNGTKYFALQSGWTHVLKELKIKKLSTVKRHMIKRYQKYGDQMAPIIPNDCVMKKINYEAMNEKLDIVGNLYASLQKLKASPKYASTIRDWSVPVAQLLSERQDMHKIEWWLREWIRSTAKTRTEVVTDMENTVQGDQKMSV
ncbi:hypothetical protein PV326_010328, partial [Microctonus aethiopoides]